ncbi:glycosyltransferase [Vibrio cholerae]
MKCKNIAFALPDFRGGGAEKVIISLANEFAKTNNVYIFVGQALGPRKDSICNFVNIIELGTKSGIKSSYKIKSLCKEKSIDAIVGTLGMAHAVAMSKLLGNKSLCIARIGNTVSQDLKNYSGLKKQLMKIYQSVLFFSDIIITQSKYMKQDLLNHILLIRFAENKIKQIYNPIDIESIRYKSLSGCSGSISDKDFVVIGRLERQKNTITILNAFLKYSRHYPQTKLHILGDGIERQELERFVSEKQLSDRVIFHGFVENPYPYILKSRAFLMSSLYEGFSNAILEAIALNKPVVVSDCPGGNREIVDEGRNGLFFKVGDSNDLFEKLLLLENIKFESTNVDKFELKNVQAQYSLLFGI